MRRIPHHHHHSSHSTWGWNWDSACWVALPRAICIQSMLRTLIWPLWGPGKASFCKMLGVLLDCHGIFWKLKTHSVAFLESSVPKTPEKEFKLCPPKGSDIYRLCDKLEVPWCQSGEKERQWVRSPRESHHERRYSGRVDQVQLEHLILEDKRFQVERKAELLTSFSPGAPRPQIPGVPVCSALGLT